MPVQDDARESQMIQLFNLSVPAERSRSDIDAHLLIDGQTINFELKSTTRGSVSTVRDFGPDHIAKWRADLHWIFAFYEPNGTTLKYCIYASPDDMKPWIAEKERYISPDLLLADAVPQHIAADTLERIIGVKRVYSLQDARWIMKNQWSAAEYVEHQDLEGGYSIGRMIEILRLRGRYIILRGSTLNNPHIEGSFFAPFDRIVDEHASTLRSRVRDYLNASATEVATAYPTGGTTEFPI